MSNQSTLQENPVINGLNTQVLGKFTNQLKENANIGKMTFISKSDWQGGGRIATRIGGYKIDGRLFHEGKREFIEYTDQPTEFTTADAAPAPIERMLQAVGSCIAATTNANAAFMGVKLNKLEVMLEGDIDLHGFFAVDKNVRPGISELRARIEIDGDADPETLREIVNRGFTYSPMRDSVNNGITITPEIVTSHKA
jgi:uncharacterized OsmC-like protein